MQDVALMSGAGRGMGLACARRLAAHATVVLADLGGDAAAQAARELERMGARAAAVTGDVTRADDVAAAVEWLCFAPGAAFVTGTDLRVDGGVMAALQSAR